MIHLADSIVRFVSRVATYLAMISMASLVILITASIVSRFFGISIPAVDDIASIMLAAVFSFGLAAAVGANEHLSINLLVEKLPPRAQWYLVRATEAITILVSLYLLSGIYRLFAAALRSNQKMLGALPIPRYVPMSIVVAGVALFAIALAFAFIRNLSSRRTAIQPEN